MIGDGQTNSVEQILKLLIHPLGQTVPRAAWLNVACAADYTRTSTRTVRQWLVSANPPPFRRVGRRWLVHSDDFDAWLRSFSKPGEQIAEIVEEVVPRVD
jgi:excisionase family DNA binding protein